MKITNIGYFLVVFCVLLVFQGNLPYFGLSTLGQSIVIAGYPYEIVNSNFTEFKSSHVGFPSEMPLSTMLIPVMLMSALKMLGVYSPIDFNVAYAVFLFFGVFGAIKILEYFEISGIKKTLLLLLLFFFPIIIQSQGYSHLHFGFTIFPFGLYLYVLLYRDMIQNKVFDWLSTSFHLISLIFYTTVLVFTDGYCFLFFAMLGTVFTFFYMLPLIRKRLYFRFFILLLTHLASFVLAYVFYTSYVGFSEYSFSGISFFSDFSIDLIYLIRPTLGVHAFWDTLGISVFRSSNFLSGDRSVWSSSFVSPLFIVLIFVYLLSKRKGNTKNNDIFLAISIVILILSLYLSLGPVIKFEAIKVDNSTQFYEGAGRYYLTGSHYLSENVPGFRNARASYRWIFLTFLSGWLLLVVLVRRICTRKANYVVSVALIFLLLQYMPNLKSLYISSVEKYSQFVDIEENFVRPLEKNISQGDVVAFLPWGNDFIISYVAPKLGFYALNIGGDKNVEIASRHWPKEMRYLNKVLDESNIDYLVLLLLNGSVDVVVLPYFNMLNAAHVWPDNSSTAKEHAWNAIRILEKYDFLNITKDSEFATISLNKVDDIELKKLQNHFVSKTSKYFGRRFLSLPSQEGVVREGCRETIGAAGFVSYGPYMELAPGNYILKVDISSGNFDEAFIDIVSEFSAKTLYNNSLDEKNVNRLNHGVKLTIDSNESNVEVRFYAGQRDVFKLCGFSLEKID